MAEDVIYLDSAATEKPLLCALDAFYDALDLSFGNPSSAHAYGQRAREALEDARARIAKCIGAKPEEIFFVSGATEGCAQVLRSLHQEGYYIKESPFEHHAVSENIPFPRNDETHDTTAYATMLVNNETGQILPVPERKSWDELVFSDLTAAVGHIPVNVKELKLDYGVFAAHKFGGLPGIGVVYAREDAPLVALMSGGGQERGARAGTESVALACAMVSALEWQCEHMEENLTRVQKLWFLMAKTLENSGTDFLINLALPRILQLSSPYILNVSFPGVEGSALALMLSKEGVMVSTGAACTTGDNAPSHVLMELYGDEARARSAIRISFSWETTKEEVVKAAEKIAECVRMLRSFGT